jgi:hypothetical protein
MRTPEAAAGVLSAVAVVGMVLQTPAGMVVGQRSNR